MRRLFHEWRTVMLGLLSLGICINFVLIAGALSRIQDQADQGRLARERQCKLAPVAWKVYRGQFEDGVITRAELRLLEGGLPARCLK